MDEIIRQKLVNLQKSANTHLVLDEEMGAKELIEVLSEIEKYGITRLDLGFNCIGRLSEKEFIDVLSQLKSSKITHLSLAYLPLEDEKVIDEVTSILKNSDVVSLNINSCISETKDCRMLLPKLKGSKIKHLGLIDNGCFSAVRAKPKELSDVLSALEGTPVTSIDFSGSLFVESQRLISSGEHIKAFSKLPATINQLTFSSAAMSRGRWDEKSLTDLAQQLSYVEEILLTDMDNTVIDDKQKLPEEVASALSILEQHIGSNIKKYKYKEAESTLKDLDIPIDVVKIVGGYTGVHFKEKKKEDKEEREPNVNNPKNPS